MDDGVPEELRKIIARGIECRGWIINSYAQFENLLSDLVRNARRLDEYADLSVPYRTDKRISCVRELIFRDGPLKKYGGSLETLIAEFETLEDARLLMVHGYSFVQHTPSGQTGFNFELYRGARDGKTRFDRLVYRPDELEKECDRFIGFAKRAFATFYALHDEMGWVGPHHSDSALE